jgi:hypothetical protein
VAADVEQTVLRFLDGVQFVICIALYLGGRAVLGKANSMSTFSDSLRKARERVALAGYALQIAAILIFLLNVWLR